MNKDYLTWIKFYTEFAEKLLPYMKDRQTLIEKIKAVYTAIDMRLPKLEKDNNIIDIDPFTIFGLFNKGITNTNRITILHGIAKEFSINAPVPESFDGIPVLNNQRATYYFSSVIAKMMILRTFGEYLRLHWSMRKPIQRIAKPH